MHYDEDRHKALVEEKSKKLDHAVRLISDDIALIHFNFDQILKINGETSD